MEVQFFPEALENSKFLNLIYFFLLDGLRENSFTNKKRNKLLKSVRPINQVNFVTPNPVYGANLAIIHIPTKETKYPKVNLTQHLSNFNFNLLARGSEINIINVHRKPENTAADNTECFADPRTKLFG